MGKEIFVTIIVSGIKFKIKRDLLVKKPNTYLGHLAVDWKVRGVGEDENEICVDRPVSSFEAILAFYLTDELHMPSTLCPKAFKKELEFWEINQTELEQCCLFKYLQFMGDIEEKQTFVKQQNKIEAPISHPDRRIRSKVWRIIDNRERSLTAKIFLIIGISFVLGSAILLSITTLPSNRRSLTACEIHHYYRKHSSGTDNDDVKKFLSFPCDDIRIGDKYIEVNSYGNFSLPDSLPTMTVKNDVFIVVECVATVFFTLELLLRLICCPSFKIYFLSWINVIDTLALISGHLTIILEYATEKHEYSNAKSIMENFQILRLMRLVRYCQHFRTIQVLKFSLMQNFRDLLVLLLYLGIGLLFFANIMYLLNGEEKINSIPEGWWLGIITMTTVGYGDVTPSTAVGKVVCGISAVGGVVLISIILPIFVDSFLNLYGVAKLNNNIDRLSHVNATKDLNGSEKTQSTTTISTTLSVKEM